MTLIEAIKSGKRFKRELWESWYEIGDHVSFSLDSVMAKDWITEPDPLPKAPRLLAYMFNEYGNNLHGTIRFLKENDHWSTPSDWIRAPHLDFPEEE